MIKNEQIDTLCSNCLCKLYFCGYFKNYPISHFQVFHELNISSAV